MDDVRIKIESLKNMLVTRARGHNEVSSSDYAQLRIELVTNEDVSDRLPEFVHTCKTLTEFWSFIQPKFPTYRERTEYIRLQFHPVLTLLERGSILPQRNQDPMKLFLTLDETKTALGKTEEDVIRLVQERSLREFRDGPRLMFKCDQVAELVKPAPTPPPTQKEVLKERVFIGHGRSKTWLELRDFLERRLKLETDEFNRESVAGRSITDRLQEMLQATNFAFLVMTAEDARADGTYHARENVIHEVGLFQGKLGFSRAIILLEDGCEQFSNIHGLIYVSFARDRISTAFEEVRLVLEREGLIPRS
jgi:hypothetical protein